MRRLCLELSLLATVAGAGCLSHPSYTAVGFACQSTRDCDTASVCTAGVCQSLSNPGDGGPSGTDGGDPRLPSASNTGVPAGVNLTPSGSVSLMNDGGVLDAANIAGCVDVYGSGVTIRRSLIRCSSGTAITVHLNAKNTLIEDVEVDGAGSAEGLSGGNYSAVRLNVHDVTQGLRVVHGASLQDSYLHMPGNPGVTTTNGAQHVSFVHNLIEVAPGDGGAIVLSSGSTQMQSVLIQNNTLTGGVYTVRIDADAGVDLKVIDNRFGRDASAGPLRVPPGTQASGNVWDDTGTDISGP